jgi:hypothetical protein
MRIAMLVNISTLGTPSAKISPRSIRVGLRGCCSGLTTGVKVAPAWRWAVVKGAFALPGCYSGVAVAVAVGVSVAVSVAVGVEVAVRVWVGVRVLVGVRVRVGVAVFPT